MADILHTHTYTHIFKQFVGKIFKGTRAHLCAQSNGLKYCYQTLIILFIINDLFAHSQMVSSIPIKL